MKYKINIEEVTEYSETKTAYEATDGKRYFSTFAVPDGVKYEVKEYKTGAMLQKEREVYSQEVELPDITDVIKAANGLLK